jgi:hypothetical protein
VTSPCVRCRTKLKQLGKEQPTDKREALGGALCYDDCATVDLALELPFRRRSRRKQLDIRSSNAKTAHVVYERRVARCWQQALAKLFFGSCKGSLSKFVFNAFRLAFSTLFAAYGFPHGHFSPFSHRSTQNRDYRKSG